LFRNGRHGSPKNGDSERHAGDLGNILADQSGRATFRIVDNVLKVSEFVAICLQLYYYLISVVIYFE
jgi:Cu/Zn superoxide dismutase